MSRLNVILAACVATAAAGLEPPARAHAAPQSPRDRMPTPDAPGQDPPPLDARSPDATTLDAPRPDAPAEASYRYGVQQLDLGNASLAVGPLHRAVLLRPDIAAYALKLAQAYDNAGSPADAEQVLQALLQRGGEQRDVRLGVGLRHAAAGRDGAVVETLLPLAEDLPITSLLTLTSAMRRVGRFEGAEQLFVQRLASAPTDAALWHAFVDDAMVAGKPAVALRRVARAERVLGHRAELHLRAARALLHLGQVLGDGRTRRFAGGRVGQIRGDWLLLEQTGADDFYCAPRRSALFQVHSAAKLGCDSAERHALEAVLLARLGKHAAALEAARRAEAQLAELNDPELLEGLTDVAAAAGAVDLHLRFAAACARVMPERRAVLLGRAYEEAGAFYNRSGDAASSAEFLEKALALQASDALRLRLADTWWDAGEHERAMPHYRAVLEGDVEHADRVRVLERVESFLEERP